MNKRRNHNRDKKKKGKILAEKKKGKKKGGKGRGALCSDDLESDTTTLLASQAYFHINDPFRTFKVMNN